MDVKRRVAAFKLNPALTQLLETDSNNIIVIMQCLLSKSTAYWEIMIIVIKIMIILSLKAFH